MGLKTKWKLNIPNAVYTFSDDGVGASENFTTIINAEKKKKLGHLHNLIGFFFRIKAYVQR